MYFFDLPFTGKYSTLFTIFIIVLSLKYLHDLKGNRSLSIIVICLMAYPVAILFNRIMNANLGIIAIPNAILISIIIRTLGVLLFLILLINRIKTTHSNIYKIMIIPVFTLFLIQLIRILHLPGVAIYFYFMIGSLIAGLFILFRNDMPEESRPFNLVMVYLFGNTAYFLHHIYTLYTI